MSYILDALRKSEQERTQGGVPGLHATHSLKMPAPQKRFGWLYLVILLCVVNALILWLWLKPAPEQRQVEKAVEQGEVLQAGVDEPAIVNPAQTPLKPTTKLVPAPDRVVTVAKTPDVEQRSVEQHAVEQPRIAAVNDGAREQPKGRVIIADAPLTDGHGMLLDERAAADMAHGVRQSQSTGAEADIEETEATTVTSKPAVEEYIQPVSELAQSLQRKIPKFSYAGHVFSDNAARRSVLINGRKLREGSVVEGDLVLEEIRLGYSVFSFQGQRFRIDMLRDWPFE